MGKYAEAESLLDLALDGLKRICFYETHFKAHVLSNLAALHFSKHDYILAEKLFYQSLDIYENSLGPYHSDTCICYENLAYIAIQKRDKKTAINIINRLIICCNYNEKNDPLETVKKIIALSEMLSAINEDENAYKELSRALEIAKKHIGVGHQLTSMVYNNLGSLLLKKNDYVSAADMLKKGYEIRRNLFGDAHLLTFTSQTNYIVSLYLTEKFSEADNLLTNALKILNYLKGDEFYYAQQILNRLKLQRQKSLQGRKYENF